MEIKNIMVLREAGPEKVFGLVFDKVTVFGSIYTTDIKPDINKASIQTRTLDVSPFPTVSIKSPDIYEEKAQPREAHSLCWP